MRILPSSLDAISRPTPLSVTYGFDFASFQRKAFRDMGIDDSALPHIALDDSSTSSPPPLVHRDFDDDESQSSATSNPHDVPGRFLHQLADMDIGLDNMVPNFTRHIESIPLDVYLSSSAADIEDGQPYGRKQRSSNRWGYQFGDWMKSPYYLEFLAPDVIERTYQKSLDKNSEFRSHFRVPLVLLDRLTDLFIEREWIRASKRQRNCFYSFRIRCQLLIMASLEHLATRKPFRQFKIVTSLSYSEHKNFTKRFIHLMSDHKHEWIKYPSTMDELRVVLDDYEKQLLPGCGGSIDVVHVKWCACPAGDKVKAKGKEKFTSIAFEVVTNNNREILGVAPPQFGTRNDQHIVRLDPTVTKLRQDWYQDVEWSMHDAEGNVIDTKGVYLICDGGYLRWKTLVCPFLHESHSSRNGYFSDNLESVRKDVECTFGILKARWRILEFGLHYRDIQLCGKVFDTCCCLHNMMLEFGDSKAKLHRVGRGAPLLGDAIYLEGPEDAYQRRRRDIVSSEWLRRKERAEA